MSDPLPPVQQSAFGGIHRKGSDAAPFSLCEIHASQVFPVSSPFKCQKRLTNPLIGDSLDYIDPYRRKDVTKGFVECPEVAGKTIKSVKIYEDDTDGYETLIEFTDGTSFSSSICFQSAVKGVLFEGGTGTPKIIRNYEL